MRLLKMSLVDKILYCVSLSIASLKILSWMLQDLSYVVYNKFNNDYEI